MKRFVAICLLIVCVTLPIISFADYVCGSCHGINAYIESKTVKTYRDTVYHMVEARKYKICRDCGYQELTYVGPSFTERHSAKHYTQQVSLHLTYEYDYCSECNTRFNTHTYYH